jgi:hypothetical protein
VLGRLDLDANHVSDANSDVAAALKLEPNSRPAQDLQRQVQAKSGQGK